MGWQQQHLLLEIAARVDPGTVLCFAATCRHLRRGILDPSFRRRRLAIVGGELDPALLLGFSYRLRDNCGSRVDDIVHTVRTATSPRPRLRVGPRLLKAFEPVAWRNGLLVLRLIDDDDAAANKYRTTTAVKFHVWDALTARSTTLPPIDVQGSRRHYPLALLDVTGDRSFELLFTEYPSMRFKIFSSKTGRWGAERAVPDRRPPPDRYPNGRRSEPVVIGRTVHWLCRGGARSRVRASTSSTWTRVVVNVWEIDTTTRARMRHAPSLEAFGERSGAVMLEICGGVLVRLDLGTKEVAVLGKYKDYGTHRVSHVCLHEMDLASLLQSMKSF
ncbi:hypothetical protein QOZ80_3BG0259020 [Eleusine coracana subsp. coracana]|nr:hypothetical protein QOZ80_3BG0259020 [Eleusine coracana subsp. coracana]